MTYIYHYDSLIGKITMASDGEALIGLWFDGQKYFADSVQGTCVEKSLPIFDDTTKWLDIYFGGKQPDFTPNIKILATPFRKVIAEIMLTIPYGKTMTYKDIARIISPKMSAQAVGSAVGHNKISILIPCHRVIGSNNNLTGYAGGIERKEILLEIEGIHV